MNEAQKYLQEIISKRKKGEKTMIFDKIKRTIHKDKRRKVITLREKPGVVDANVTCYFNKTITEINSTSVGDIYTSRLAELETMEGKLIYVGPGIIKFID